MHPPKWSGKIRNDDSFVLYVHRTLAHRRDHEHRHKWEHAGVHVCITLYKQPHTFYSCIPDPPNSPSLSQTHAQLNMYEESLKTHKHSTLTITRLSHTHTFSLRAMVRSLTGGGGGGGGVRRREGGRVIKRERAERMR